jgi:hypothetical protein
MFKEARLLMYEAAVSQLEQLCVTHFQVRVHLLLYSCREEKLKVCRM